MYDAGIKGYYDGLAVQFYDLPLMALRTTHAVQRKYHDKAPLWLTEFGFTSCAGPKKLPAFLADHPCVTRAVQARDLADMVAALRRTSWVRATVVYAARDESTAYQFGLLDSTGRHKPSYNVVRKALRSRTHLRSGKVKLVRRRSGVSVFGDVPGLDLYTLRAYVHGTLRFRATLRTNRLNHFSLKLPASLGRHGLRVTLTSAWSHRRLTAR
jgi:hypothetical protein